MEAVLIETNDTASSFTQKIYEHVREHQGRHLEGATIADSVCFM